MQWPEVDISRSPLLISPSVSQTGHLSMKLERVVLARYWPMSAREEPCLCAPLQFQAWPHALLQIPFMWVQRIWTQARLLVQQPLYPVTSPAINTAHFIQVAQLQFQQNVQCKKELLGTPATTTQLEHLNCLKQLFWRRILLLLWMSHNKSTICSTTGWRENVQSTVEYCTINCNH